VRVIDEVRAFNAEIERTAATLAPVHTVAPEETRRARREGRRLFPAPVFLPQARWVDAGGVRLRAIAPTGEANGVYLHVHGGGWTLGAADMQDVLLRTLADETGLVAASVEYRLAPEDPYPAGPDDCEAAALWLLDEGAEQLATPARFAIGGESAGAQLAATTLLRLRDRHGRTGGFSRANLVFGVFDLSSTPSRRLHLGGDPILTQETMDWFVDNFVPGTDAEARRDPDVSPLYADLHGLPSALFTVGTRDPLLDDTLFMEARWRAAGNEARLSVVPEALHGFNAFPLEAARMSLAEQHAFLRSI